MTEKQPRGFLPEWILNAVFLLFAFTMVAQPYVIPSGSMENNLRAGDYVVVDKLAYSPAGSLTRHLLPYTPVRRGDIVVFRYPVDLTQTYVKRVIGFPGDRIRIRDKQVWINGRRMVEPYKVHNSGYLDEYRDNFPAEPNGPVDARALAMLRDNVEHGELVVPAGRYFVMGDNRDNSLDSRYWGLVPRENIIGKPLMVLWSFNAPQELLADPNRRPELLVDVALHLFTRVRWNRTLRFVPGYPLD